MLGGEQTPESIVSIICEAFGCLPGDALEEDPKWIIAVLEYRLARQARDGFNSKQKLSTPAAELFASINLELERRGKFRDGKNESTGAAGTETKD